MRPPDLLVDDRRADRLFRDCGQARPVELRSNLRGYEGAGDPIGLEEADS